MNSKKPRIYLETTIVSYLTARPSRDLIVIAHQGITQEWWEQQRQHYDIYVSDLVYLEAERGDPDASKQRVELIRPFKVLADNNETQKLAEIYAREIPLTPKTSADSLHLSIAAWYSMEYLLTWNCRHIANGFVRRRLEEINRRLGILTPTICTPEELLYGIETMD